MKMFFSLIVLVSSFSASAATHLFCATDKAEIDPEDKWFKMASDSNQHIDANLVEKNRHGKTILSIEGEQTLKYVFSQSSGGYSPWSMIVKRAIVDGEDVRLYVEIKNETKTDLKAVIDLKLDRHNEGGHDGTGVFMVNELLTLDGSRVVYDLTEQMGKRFEKKFKEVYEKGLLKKHDLVGIAINWCQLRDK